MKKGIKVFIGLVVVVALLSWCSSMFGIAVPISSKEAIGKNCDEVVNELSEAGFKNITTTEVKTDDEEDNGKITWIKINGQDQFDEGTSYLKGADVVIRYYKLEERTKEPKKEEEEQQAKEKTEEVEGEAAEAESQEEQQAEEEPDFFDVWQKINFLMASTFENYTMDRDDYGFIVNVWQDGTAMNAVLAQRGDQEAKAKWDETVETLKTISKQTKEGVVAPGGFQDKMFVINLLNDMNQDATLLTIADGSVLYDTVNGIDIMHIEQ